MYSNKINGTSAVDYFIVIILLIAFFVIGVVITSSVFHFAILPSGLIAGGSGSPVACNANVTNISTNSKQNTFKITVSEGSPGLIYNVFASNTVQSNPSSLSRIGNYTAGINSFSEDLTIINAEINTVIIGNTSGSTVSIDGIKYSAGGTCETEILGIVTLHPPLISYLNGVINANNSVASNTQSNFTVIAPTNDYYVSIYINGTEVVPLTKGKATYLKTLPAGLYKVTAHSNSSEIFNVTYYERVTPPSVLLSTFEESHLPSGYTWYVTYDGTEDNSITSSISFQNTISGSSIPTYTYLVKTLTNSSASPDCTTTYTPSPSSGSAEAGTTTSISFSASTTCTTTFDESNLASGYAWTVNYDSGTNSSTTPSSVKFSTTIPGAGYSYSYAASATAYVANNGVCTSSASVSLGETYTFTNWMCKFPFTIDNTQSVSTPVPFQQEANISLSDFSGYESSNLQNVEFSYQNGTIIPSWLESYSSTNAIWWLKIGGGVPANSVLTIEAELALPTSTVLFNNVNNGEAPTLSSSYGEYDDGANVFNLYSNFAGTSLPSGFTTYISSGSSISIDNGITFSVGDSADPSYSFILYNKEYQNSIVDAYITSIPAGDAENFQFPGFTSSTINNGMNNYVGISYYETCGKVDHGFTLNNVSGISSNTNSLYADTVISSSNSLVSAYIDYSSILTSTDNGISSDSYPVLGFQSLGSGSGCQGIESDSYQWYDVRSEPPKGIMPTMQQLILPSGIIYYAPVTIINTQSVSTLAPFQQEANISLSSFSGYQASNLQNIEFFYSNGTIIPSWLESYSSTNAIWWLKLGSIPANSKITVYMGMASTSTNLFNTVNDGEAPQLTCPNPSDTASCSTYAEYDDGANVFNFYSDFKGTSLNTNKWSSSLPYIIDNGLTLKNESSSSSVYGSLNSVSSFSAGSVFDFYGEPTNNNGQGGFDFGVGDCINCNPTGDSWMVGASNGANGPSSGYSLYLNESHILTNYAQGYGVWTVGLYPNGKTAYSEFNYGDEYTVTNSAFLPSLNSYQLVIHYGDSGNTFFQWFDERSAPPNGIMPSINIGSVQS